MRQDLQVLELAAREEGGLSALAEPEERGAVAAAFEPRRVDQLRQAFGVFLVFLNQFSERRLGELRSATGLVIQHSLDRIGELAAAAHQEALDRNRDPAWVVQLVDLTASLRPLSATLAPGVEHPGLGDFWTAFLMETREPFRSLLAALAEQEGGAALAARLRAQMKTINRALRSGSGHPSAAIRNLELLLESALPEDIRLRAEPVLLVQHVVDSLRVSLVRPLDRGVHWPAVEQIKGSLQWLWNHLGWDMPRIGGQALDQGLPEEVHALLRNLKEEHPQAFRLLARALASHLALLELLEGLEPAVNATVPHRYAQVPTYRVIEAELGRLAERTFHPRAAQSMPAGSPDALMLDGFLRQAVLSLLQDQATIHSLLQQALANEDVDQLATVLDNLRALLRNHQRQLMGDLVGMFSPDLRRKLFPESPSLTEEGDRLRQRLYRLWLYLDPVQTRIQVHLELRDWPRLALVLAQAQSQVASFRRSPEFLLIRSQDRQEFERLTSQLTRALDEPEEIEPALQEGAELTGELLRFLDVFLLRINARVPLIRLDLDSSREAGRLADGLLDPGGDSAERPRAVHKLIQAAKTLAIRDPQCLALLRRWIRAERGGREYRGPLEALRSHLQHLATRLDTALN